MGLIKTFKLSANPVVEGVTAVGRSKYAIAIKKTNGNILLDKGNAKFISNLPIIFVRGVIKLFEAGALLYKTLLYSAEYFDSEVKEEGETEILFKEEWLKNQDKAKAENSLAWLKFFGTLVLMLAVILGFFILPVVISSLFSNNYGDGQWILFNVIECISRIVLLIIGFVVFKFAGGVFANIRQYSCAINKVLNCFEADRELSIENVKQAYKFHPRALSYIFFLSIVICSIALIFVKMDSLFLAFLIRAGVLVLSIGVAYEISRLFGMFNGGVSKTISMICGMWIEYFTVTEPNDIQLYVAIAAVKNAMIED